MTVRPVPIAWSSVVVATTARIALSAAARTVSFGSASWNT